MLDIRTMRTTDLPTGLALCRFAGWNQDQKDWLRLFALAPNSVFVAESDGHPCGTASITCYGAELAWLGMVLVHPDYRRRGIANALMQRCLEYAHHAQVRTVKLDATDQGRSLYLKLGFREECPISRYSGTRASSALPTLPRIEDSDWPRIALLDRQAFGADRLSLLRLLAGETISAVMRTTQGTAGYGFARPGFNASFIGPIVANDAGTAHRLIETLLAQLPERPVFWDILSDNSAAADVAASHGFTVARRLVRMNYGVPSQTGSPNSIFAAAGFEYG